MRYLRTNTAARITVGPFFDKTDGVTPEVAITVTSEKLTFMVDDGNVPTLVLDTAPTASGGANDMVHVTGDDAGFYDLELAAANVNYLGRAMLALTDAATHCPVFHEFMILPAMIYDSIVLGTDRLDTNVTHIADTAQTARDIGASVLLSSGTGTGQVKIASGYLAMTWADIAAPTTVVALSGTTVKTATDVETDTQDIQGRLPAALTANGNIKSSMVEILTTALTETAGLLAGGFKKFFNIASPVSTMDVVARVTLTDTLTTYTGNTVQTGDGYAVVNSGTFGNAALKTLIDTVATYVDTEVAAIKAKTDNLPASPAATGDAMALTAGERTTVSDVILARALAAESYAADGAVPTLSQILYRICQNLCEFAIAGTTITTKKLNKSTTAETYTLDSSTAPTSRTRAT